MFQSVSIKVLLLLSGLFFHPFHVSVCEIEYNSDHNSLEVIHKFFLDDLELALNSHFDLELNLMTQPDPDKIDKLMKDYLSEKFRIRVDGKSSIPNYLGHEIEDGAIWFYLEIPDIHKFSSLDILNSALLETFDDQQNMVHFYKGELTRSLLLTNGKESGTIRLAN